MWADISHTCLLLLLEYLLAGEINRVPSRRWDPQSCPHHRLSQWGNHLRCLSSSLSNKWPLWVGFSRWAFLLICPALSHVKLTNMNYISLMEGMSTLPCLLVPCGPRNTTPDHPTQEGYYWAANPKVPLELPSLLAQGGRCPGGVEFDLRPFSRDHGCSRRPGGILRSECWLWVARSFLCPALMPHVLVGPRIGKWRRIHPKVYSKGRTRT